MFSLPPALNGTGVPVAQVEADFAPDQFEVNPSAANQPASLFTYISDQGTAIGTFPNSVGTESGHADTVGQIFYGNGSGGAASGVSHVDNYEVNQFVNGVITASTPPNIAAKVVNQSFVADGVYPTLDQAYDDYIAEYNKIIVSAAGSGPPESPSTSYNGISVGTSDGNPTVGPTPDGRSKPDISAPGGDTSFTAPRVSAAAAILVQAGQSGYGGPGTGAGATDARTVKALLLNGADKPAGWTHTATTPLDPRYGAGVVDVNNSFQELSAGRDTAVVRTLSALGSHLPLRSSASSSPNLSGWDFNTITSNAQSDGVNHYQFQVKGSASTVYSLTATLAWERHQGQSGINNLDLYLYNDDTHSVVDQSVSGVDNVEHLFTMNLAPGHYEVEVVKAGGTPGTTAGDVSNDETYALAFNFATTSTTKANPAKSIVAAALARRPLLPNPIFGSAPPAFAAAVTVQTHAPSALFATPAPGAVQPATGSMTNASSFVASAVNAYANAMVGSSLADNLLASVLR